MSNYLTTGQALRTNEYRVAPDGSCYLIMQGDGNLCLYRGDGPQHRGAFVWGALSSSLPGGNYFTVMQGDGNLCIYAGTPEAPGRYVWSTGTVAPGGAFVAAVENGAKVTVSKGRPDDPGHQAVLWASRRLRVMTFNTHLIEGSNIEFGAAFKSKLPVDFRDEERHGFIVRKVKESGADVVALQEVWSAERMDRILFDLRDVYPHGVRGTNGPFYKAGSGIVLVSKYPLENWDFREFAETPDEDSEDAWASKGALFGTVVLEPDRLKLRVGMTHAWTNAGSKQKACPNISDLVSWTLTGFDDLPAVLMGDYNVHRMSDPEKYDALNGVMASKSATDSWTRVHGTTSPAESATDDQIDNVLNQFFSPDRDTPSPDCIDYVYLKDGKTTPLRPINARVVRDWKYALGFSTPVWYWVHRGSGWGMATAATFEDKLCVVVRSPSNTLQVSLIDQVSRRWTHYDIPNVTSDGSPGLVWFAGCLHLFFQQGRTVYKMESTDGRNWTPKQKQGDDIRSSGGVCAVVFRGVLYLFCRDPNGDGNQVCVHTWTNRWSDRKWVHIDTRHDISAAAGDNTICVVSIDPGSKSTGGLMRSVLGDDGNWHGAQMGRGIVTSGSPGIAVQDGTFHVFYREPDGGGFFHRSSRDGVNWSDFDFNAHMATSNAVCPVVFGGKMLVFFPFVVNADDHLIYTKFALAHMHYPPTVDLDASDHYPYVVDFVWP